MKAISNELPAIAGGEPAFRERLPMVRPEGVDEAAARDLRAEYEAILTSRQLTNGVRVRAFEEAAAAWLGVPHAVAVASCTSGLLMALRALIGPAPRKDGRDEVILPSFTFHATAHSVVWNGFKPVFADCEPDTFCISPVAVRAQLSPRTAAILAVHMYGHPAEVEALAAIAAERGIALVFDAAHAFGSAWRTPQQPEEAARRIGRFGDAEIFSFSPTKLLVAGEGGLVTTRSAALAAQMRAARNYGDPGTYDPEIAGLNARMTEFHAALALRGLEGLEQRLRQRNAVRLRYEQRLAAVPGLRFQQIRAGCTSTCKDFSVLVDAAAFGASRDWLFDALVAENIEVKRYFWPPVHRQQLYRPVWDGRPLPVTDAISDSVLSVPIYSTLSDEAVDRVCDAIRRAHLYARSQRSPQLSAKETSA